MPMQPIKDPVTFDIIQNSLEAIADEMFAAMRKTAMSAIIYEVLDLGTGITDADGEIAASGAGIPAFIGVLDKAVKAILRKHNQGGIAPGDVFAVNDPYDGGVTHLNDIVLAMPVFVDSTLVAWTATIAHFNDVGGMVPGSMSTDAYEIFQEGIRIPAIKIIDAGKPNQTVIDVMTVNSRLPAFLRGRPVVGDRRGEDRRAPAARTRARNTARATFRVGDRALHGLWRAGLAEGARDACPRAASNSRRSRTTAPSIRSRSRSPTKHFVVDLTENPDQVRGPTNASRDGVIICAQMAFKAFSAAGGLANGGSFRPLQVITRPGSIFDPVEPAAIGFYFEVEVRVFDLMLRCLAPHMPNLLPAGGFASICGTVIGGPHPDTGRHYTIVEPQLGGWGAMRGRDGNSAIFSGFHGETFNCPAEVAEARYGLAVDRMMLNPEQGGEGRWRGGKGIEVDYRVRADGNFMTVGYTRSRIPPWGLAGGADGTHELCRSRASPPASANAIRSPRA